VWAECLFANPVADIAVLGSPDDQALFDQADAYEKLLEPLAPFRIADAPEEERRCWMLSLEGEWFGCTVEHIKEIDGELWICNSAQPIAGGMSGSPIISDQGAAIGVVTLGSATELFTPQCEDQYGTQNPRLVRDLPGWLLQAQP
jgi:hypothetical protein